MTTICPGLHQIPVGVTNVFLLRDGEELTLIDAGPQGKAQELMEGLEQIGVAPSDIENILVTHCHQDHSGALKSVKEATGADVWMHPRDAKLVEQGRSRRPWTVTPGIFHRILYWIYVKGVPVDIPEVEIEHEIQDDQTLPVAGGLRAVLVPGHCAGQIAFLWPKQGGVLFAADAALSLFGRPLLSIVYEDLDQGREDVTRLANLDFETAVFSHGAPFLNDAAAQFRRYAPAT